MLYVTQRTRKKSSLAFYDPLLPGALFTVDWIALVRPTSDLLVISRNCNPITTVLVSFACRTVGFRSCRQFGIKSNFLNWSIENYVVSQLNSLTFSAFHKDKGQRFSNILSVAPYKCELTMSNTVKKTAAFGDSSNHSTGEDIVREMDRGKSQVKETLYENFSQWLCTTGIASLKYI